MVQSFNKKAALKPILYGLLLVVVFHLITVSIGLAPDFAGNNWYLNWDTDSYSRILGILKLYQ